METTKENDNVNTVLGLKETIQEWLESLEMPFEGWDKPRIDELEFESRDGFHANSWNRGGLDLFHVTDIRSLTGSGEHIGLSIENWVNEQHEESCKDALAKGLKEQTEEFYDFVDERTGGEYDCVAYRIRVMYEGNGVLKIYAGYDKDAPYFRWREKAEVEHEINFKSIKELKKKLAKLEI